MKHPLILIAEDDQTLRDLYARKFRLAGYEIATVPDGSDAIAFLKKEQPDVVICDIRMQKVDGFQVLEAFPRKTRPYPIILLTNFDREDYRTQAEKLGADGYCVKMQMTIRSLVDLVEKLLASRGKMH